MKILILTLFLYTAAVYSVSFGQGFEQLIGQTNYYLKMYSGFIPFGESALSEIQLSFQEKQELETSAEIESALTEKKDSVDNYFVISFLQDKIIHNLVQLIEHTEFLNHDITELFDETLTIVKSEDDNVFNFILDEKTGGSYRSQLSVLYFSDVNILLTPEDHELTMDGYTAIYPVDTYEGRKYLLIGDRVGCTFCFASYVQLIGFHGDEIMQDFFFYVDNRDMFKEVVYDAVTKTITVEYMLDDLTPLCECEEPSIDDGVDYDWDESKSVSCRCRFAFDGTTFQLIEESRNRIEENEED